MSSGEGQKRERRETRWKTQGWIQPPCSRINVHRKATCLPGCDWAAPVGKSIICSCWHCAVFLSVRHNVLRSILSSLCHAILILPWTWTSSFFSLRRHFLALLYRDFLQRTDVFMQMLRRESLCLLWCVTAPASVQCYSGNQSLLLSLQ